MPDTAETFARCATWAVALAMTAWAGSAVASTASTMANSFGPALHTVYFAFGADAPSPAQHRALERVAATLERGRALSVTGFTDDIGPRAYNERLAGRRAESVAGVLERAGVARQLMRVEARGRADFRASNETRDGRAQNRRVELRYRGGGSPRPAAGRAKTPREPANAAPAQDGLRVGRYSTVAPVPTAAERDPLATLVQITFPADVRTVGAALRHLIVRSGWRLAAERAADPTMRELVTLALPASQRDLGPLALLDAVAVICGETYAVAIDPVHRLLSCELRGVHADYWRGSPPGSPL